MCIINLNINKRKTLVKYLTIRSQSSPKNSDFFMKANYWWPTGLKIEDKSDSRSVENMENGKK